MQRAVHHASFLALPIAWAPATALACPDCAVGRVARSMVWQELWGTPLLAALAPFFVIVAVSFWADRGHQSRSS